MSTALATRNGMQVATSEDPILQDESLWQVVSTGDLKGLTAAQKSKFYLYRCRQEGLNPASQPFVYMTQQGKEILYAGKGAADQLRKLHGISIVEVVCTQDDEYIEFQVRVRDREGREDFEIGSVFAGTSKGVERSNNRMKALTKAKRRATYSICGTGALDETEVETLLGASRETQYLPVTAEVVDTGTGEIVPAEETLEGVKRHIRDLTAYAEWSKEDLGLVAKELELPSWVKMDLAQAQTLRDEITQRIEEAEAAHDASDLHPDMQRLIDAETRPADSDRYTR